jgi:hypothetical protein
VIARFNGGLWAAQLVHWGELLLSAVSGIRDVRWARESGGEGAGEGASDEGRYC